MDKINILEKEIADLRKILQEKEAELYRVKNNWMSGTQNNILSTNNYSDPHYNHEGNQARTQIGDKLPKWAIERYSRQILLPNIGVKGQEKLCAARVLIVGAGGLACPAAVYLAGAGVGEIGIVDYDAVDITNIHRQFLHDENDQYMSKAESAAAKLRSLNSHIKVTPYNMQLDSSNALQIARQYDIVLDCTDNVPTRYLLNDTCVLAKIPLISGSALKMEGQLTVYGYRANDKPNENDPDGVGPCYRCVFPCPPPAAAVGSCSSNGVAGPVPGAIGALQALEAMKYIVGQSRGQLLVERMLLFDGEDMTFRTVKLRPRNVACAACGDSPTITRLVDYEAFCQAQAKEKDLDLDILPPLHRISPENLDKTLKTENSEQRHLLVDVRSEPEFLMCNIDGSTSCPIDNLTKEKLGALVEKIKSGDQVTFICRRGNDSQIVAQKVLELLEPSLRSRVRDLQGGLHSWSKHVDNDFPVY